MNRVPTVDEYVGAFLTAFRAPLKESTMFTTAGRSVQHRDGERLIYGPNGAVIGRVREDVMHGTHIEQNDRLHAVARPPSIRMLATRNPDGSIREVVKQWQQH